MSVILASGQCPVAFGPCKADVAFPILSPQFVPRETLRSGAESFFV